MYKIVVDSCGELPEELKKDGHFETVSLELEVDGYRIKDDETFNQLDFLRRVKKSITGPKSACPSPEQYMRLYKGEAEHVYVVTLSGKLSGSYNSAELGRNLYEEEHPGENKQIYVFNSRSASIGETIIGLKVQEFEEAGLPFEEVVARTEEYISSMNTYFCLRDVRDSAQERKTDQSESADCQYAQYQAGDGFHKGGHDLPARSGARNEQGT